MNRRKDRVPEVLDVAMLGFMSAVPLAVVAFGVQQLGWHALPMVGFPLYCAWSVGRQTARTKWMLVHEARLAEVERQIACLLLATEKESGEP